MSSTPAEGALAYFRRLEEAFIRVRGAPLLLSPADWHVAREWHREGVPLELVVGAIEEVFRRRAERGAEGGIQSLRYCAPAVEEAWHAYRELTAAGASTPGEGEVLPLAERLEALAGSLPERLPERGAMAARIRSLEGSLPAVEKRLEALDGELLAWAEESLGPRERESLEGAVDAALAAVGSRFTRRQRGEAAGRLFRDLLRRRLRLPHLSLVAPPPATD